MAQTPFLVKEIRDEEPFLRLREPWNQLVMRASRSVFFRHEWFTAAWAWRRTDAVLRILCVYSGDSLLGVFPLLHTSGGSTPGRLLAFLIVPDSQCCDVLADRQHAKEVCTALVDYLIQTSSEWDELRLCRLPLNSIAETDLKPLLATRAAHCHFHADDCNLYVDLGGTWADYYATRSRSLKKSCNLAYNRLARYGSFEVENLSAQRVERPCLSRLVDEIVAISAKSWKQATGNTLDAAGPHAFIQRLTDQAYDNDWLSVWILRIRGQAVAMEYQLVCGKSVHALRADFVGEYGSLSPGSYLNRYLLEQLFAAGLERYYMGPGQNPVQDALEQLRRSAPQFDRVCPDPAWTRSVAVAAQTEAEIAYAQRSTETI